MTHMQLVKAEQNMQQVRLHSYKQHFTYKVLLTPQAVMRHSVLNVL